MRAERAPIGGCQSPSIRRSGWPAAPPTEPAGGLHSAGGPFSWVTDMKPHTPGEFRLQWGPLLTGILVAASWVFGVWAIVTLGRWPLQ